MVFLFYTYDMSMTGGSKVCAELINELALTGHKVHLFLDRNRVAFPLHENVTTYIIKQNKIITIKPNIKEYFSNKEKLLKNKKTKKHSYLSKKNRELKKKLRFIKNTKLYIKYIFGLIHYRKKKNILQSAIKKISPNIIITSNMYHDLEYLFYLKSKNTYLWLHNSPLDVFKNRGVRKILPFHFYLKDIKFISVSEGIKNELKIFNENKQCQTIYNPFDFYKIKEKSLEPLPQEIEGKKYIVSVSGLDHRKRVDRIIKSFYKIHDRNKELNLVILGQGEEESSLQLLVEKLKIQHKVFFLGIQKNPFKYMKNAEMLVLSSNSEGLPTVLIESLIVGTPVISTDCPTGPNEILLGELSKYLVPIKNKKEQDIIDSITKKISLILEKPPTILKRHTEQFDKDTIVKKWINLIS